MCHGKYKYEIDIIPGLENLTINLGLFSYKPISHGLPCFVTLELDPGGISALTTGKMLDFLMKRHYETKAERKDAPLFWYPGFLCGASRLV
jgi:hypothetical protein